MKMFRQLTSFVSISLLCLITTVASAQAANRDEVIFFFNDHLGSAVAAVNEAGELCWSEEYTAYGDKGINDDVFNTTGCGIVGEERGFTGHTEDMNSDLVYMQQRYYDPSIGRFLSIDPIDSNPNNPKTFNRYAYANNNPYRYTDPTGEIPFDTVFDAVSVVYDIGKIGVGYATGNSTMISDGVIDLTGDIGALLTPYVPAGGTKVARALAKASNKVPNKALPSVKKAVNSNLPHAADRAVERGVFPDAKTAAEKLKDLSQSISRDGFPAGSLADTANANRVLVPVGNNGMAVYQVAKNGTAKLKTTLIAN